MLHKTRAIVLHHINFGESSLIATLYTEERGRISCMVNSVRSKKPKFPPTLFQPLTILDVDLYYRQSREIQRIKDVASPFHFQTIPYNYSKNAIALFLSEVLYLVLREEESNPVLFSFLYHSLQLFDSVELGTATFHHWFMMQLTRYLGFFPHDPESTVFYEIQAFSGMNNQLAENLKQLMEVSDCLPVLSLNRQERNLLLERIIRYYSLHVDGFSRLKSFDILQEIFENQPRGI